MENILIILALLAWIPTSQAAYKETMDPKGLTKNLKTDFGLVDENDRVLKRVRGPSIGVVRNSTAGSWNPIIENVTSEGFKYNQGILITYEKSPGNWKERLKGLPLCDQLLKAMEARQEDE